MATRPASPLALALVVFAGLALCGAVRGQEGSAAPPEGPDAPSVTPGDAPAPEDPGEDARAQERELQMQARRERLRANLERWNSLSPEERDRMRAQVHRALQQEREARERMLAKARRLEELSEEEREELRGKVEELQARRRHAEQRERIDAQRARMRAMPPEQRKRYMVLRHIIHGLPPERAAELRELPGEQRLEVLRQLVEERGPEFLVRQICRRAPQLEQRLRESPPAELRELFRAWLDSPEPSPIQFLRRRGLAPPGPMGRGDRMRGPRGGDWPGRGRGPHGPRWRGGDRGPDGGGAEGEEPERREPPEGDPPPRDDDPRDDQDELRGWF